MDDLIIGLPPATCNKEYEETGLPAPTAVFTGAQLNRLTFQWIIATAVSLQLVIFFGLIRSSPVHISLLAVSLWLAINGINFMRAHASGYTGVFNKTNHFMLMVMTFVFLINCPVSFSSKLCHN